MEVAVATVMSEIFSALRYTKEIRWMYSVSRHKTLLCTLLGCLLTLYLLLFELFKLAFIKSKSSFP